MNQLQIQDFKYFIQLYDDHKHNRIRTFSKFTNKIRKFESTKIRKARKIKIGEESTTLK